MSTSTRGPSPPLAVSGLSQGFFSSLPSSSAGRSPIPQQKLAHNWDERQGVVRLSCARHFQGQRLYPMGRTSRPAVTARQGTQLGLGHGQAWDSTRHGEEEQQGEARACPFPCRHAGWLLPALPALAPAPDSSCGPSKSRGKEEPRGGGRQMLGRGHR